MYRLLYTLLILTICCIRFAPLAEAQDNDPCGCNIALRKDISHIVHSVTQQEAFLKTVDKESFDEAKSSGGFGISIPIFDEIVKVSANWDDFQQRRDKYFQEVKYNKTYSEAWDILTSVTAPIAYTAWMECKKNCATDHVGLTGWKEFENEEVIVCTFFFRNPPNINKVKFKGTVINGKVDGAPTGQLVSAGTQIGANESKSFVVKRLDPAKKVTIVATAEGYPADTVLSTWSKPWPEYTVTIFRPEVQIKDIGRISRYYLSPDRSNKSPYQNTWVFEAAVGRKLKSPTPPKLVGPPDEIAAFCEKDVWPFGKNFCKKWKNVDLFAKLKSQTLNSKGTTLTTVFDTWSRPSKWEITAVEYEEISQAKMESFTRSLTFGKSFKVTVPRDATNALLEVSADNAVSLVKVGDDSPDGKIRLLNKVDLGPGGFAYEYIANLGSSAPLSTKLSDVILMLQPDKTEPSQVTPVAN